jgi:hypothetical protein
LLFRDLKAKGLKKQSVSTNYFKNRAKKTDEVKTETRGRFSKFMDEKKPTVLEDDEDAQPTNEEIMRTLCRDADLSRIRGHVPTPNTYSVSLFNEFVELDTSDGASAVSDDVPDEFEITASNVDKKKPMLLSESSSCGVLANSKSFRASSSKRFSVKSLKGGSLKSASSRSHGTVTSLPSVDKARADKYFGFEAKQLFYSTYHELDKRKNILTGGCDEMDNVIRLTDANNALKQSMHSLVESGVLTPPQSGRPSRATSPDNNSLPALSGYNSPVGKTPMDSPLPPSRKQSELSVNSMTTSIPLLSPLPLPTTSQSQLFPSVTVGIKAAQGESFLVGPRSIERGVIKENSICSMASTTLNPIESIFSPSSKSRTSVKTTTSRIHDASTKAGLSRSPSGPVGEGVSKSQKASAATTADKSQKRSTTDGVAASSVSNKLLSNMGSLRLGGQDSLYDDDSSSVAAMSARDFGVNSTVSYAANNNTTANNPRASSTKFKSGSTYGTATTGADGGGPQHMKFKDGFELKSYLDVISGSTFDVSSPRATFLNGCIKNHLPPRAVAIVRRNLSTTLNLSHVGIGDVLGILLAKSLASIPGLISLNLEDNNLTDPGLTAILNALSSSNPQQHTLQLEELNIGSNKIDNEAAEALRRFIGNPYVTLKSLHLKQADIDDGECAEFIDALMHNRFLQELDLSYNMLGKSENLNAIYPDLITGGESLATLIRDGGCPLRRLNLTWNMIRLGGANDLCDSIRNSESLEYLDLSYNALGQEASSILGSALIDNKMLTHLILSNNGIDEIGAFTLGVGMKENTSLKVVNLDGNPIGEQGGKMLMQVALYCGNRVTFSTLSCDLKIRSPSTILKMQGR